MTSQTEGKAVEVDSVCKSFGTVDALQGLTFSADVGSVLGILGPNGAGKTTVIDILCTLSTMDSGKATVCGFDVATHPAAVRERISMTGQYAALDETLNGRENLIFFGAMMGLRTRTARTRADYLLERFDLTDAASRAVSTYSGGMRRRLDIACGLVVKPSVVFLDEPTTGLDPRSRGRVWDLVESLSQDGITTILTTQYLDEADRLSDRIVVVDHGRVVADGTAADLKAAVGDTRCEALLENPGDTDRFAALLRDKFGESALTETAAGVVRMRAPDGVDTMSQIIECAGIASIRLRDIGLRNPSLDDVFLTLTSPAAP
ncbi:daunorubicin resistance protein DrrA family ABC transporter ATP-binding protein [Rhodococcoides trifolii]|uniref:Daunorubicin resistance protein DrrA family ABC transporter ATP-binding protein n=1 Tax=Rhodococcoides trifolii TaxID=908250 RepID=A0A917LH93_9NOCA|nr:ATP-binding cassette domain-containing protein [Rhodococcus trifolii]GGG23277.1 daunorubicin resistance protein DrrA family ABC transporter ATP-binding protein [Rhodococcus trifolii]